MESADLERLTVLQTEVGRAGPSVNALQASLLRLRSPEAMLDSAVSEAPLPTYVTGR